LGYQQTFRSARDIYFTPKADILQRNRHVRSTPKADINWLSKSQRFATQDRGEVVERRG
jgi:hypothetical protein